MEYGRGWDWCRYYWGFVKHITKTNICWNIYIYIISPVVGWCETLGHQSQALYGHTMPYTFLILIVSCVFSGFGWSLGHTRHTISDWWFGTFFIFPYIGNNNPNWLIFFRGVQTTNQYLVEICFRNGYEGINKPPRIHRGCQHVEIERGALTRLLLEAPGNLLSLGQKSAKANFRIGFQLDPTRNPQRHEQTSLNSSQNIFKKHPTLQRDSI